MCLVKKSEKSDEKCLSVKSSCTHEAPAPVVENGGVRVGGDLVKYSF